MGLIAGIANAIETSSNDGVATGGGGGRVFQNLYSMAFDAVDDTIVVPYSSTLDVAGGNHSLSFWMKNSVGNVRVIMEKGPNDELAALLINNKIYWGGANGYYGGTVSLVDGNWHHIVFVATGTTSEIFIDGSSVATGGDKTHAVLNTSDLNIGTRGGSYTYGGLLDEVAIFDYALSSSDVTSMYNSGVPNNLNDLSTAPVVWLRMGESGNWKSTQWLLPEDSNKDKVSNYSFEFDGVDDKISLGSSIDLGLNSTISLWVKRVSGIGQVFLGEASYNSDYLLYVTTTLFFRIGNNAKNFAGATVEGIMNDTTNWINIIFVRSGDSVELFLNGSSMGSKTGLGTTVTTKIDTIGDRPTGSFPSTGNFDEIAFWDSALTSGNVTSIYNSGEPTTLPVTPVAHYKMGEEATFTDNWLVNNSALDNYSTRSFNFDGVDDYINMGNPTDLQITGALSISAWVKFTGDSGPVVTKSRTSGGVRSYGLWGDRSGSSHRPVFFIYNSGTAYSTPDTGARVDDGNWHHLLAVFNPSTYLRLYIDGNLEQENTTSIPATIDNDSVDFYIGSSELSSFFFTGNIDEVAVWNSDQSSNVSSIYNSGEPTTITGAVAHWRMGENATFSTNWTVPDQVGSNDGTSANMDLADLEGDAPNYTGGGLSANMTIEDRVGEAPNSSNNSISYNMDKVDRETDVPS